MVHAKPRLPRPGVADKFLILEQGVRLLGQGTKVGQASVMPDRCKKRESSIAVCVISLKTFPRNYLGAGPSLVARICLNGIPHYFIASGIWIIASDRHRRDVAPRVSLHGILWYPKSIGVHEA